MNIENNRQMFHPKNYVGEHMAQLETLAKRWLISLPTPKMSDWGQLEEVERHVIQGLVMEQTRAG